MLWLQCCSRARIKGLECTLSKADILRILQPMQCEMTGIELSWEWEGPGHNPWRPSLDRKNNALGYTEGNVRLVCWAFNKARSDWPDEIFDRAAREYVKRQDNVKS